MADLVINLKIAGTILKDIIWFLTTLKGRSMVMSLDMDAQFGHEAENSQRMLTVFPNEEGIVISSPGLWTIPKVIGEAPRGNFYY